MTSNLQPKIREIRSKLQELNEARKTDLVLSDLKSKRQTVHNIFNSIQDKLHTRSTNTKPEIQNLTLKLVELSEQSTQVPQAEILPKFNLLFEEVLVYQGSLNHEYEQIKNAGFHDIRFILGEQTANDQLDEEKVGDVSTKFEIQTQQAAGNGQLAENIKSLQKQVSEMKLQAEKQAAIRAQKQGEITLLKKQAETDQKKWEDTVRALELQLNSLKLTKDKTEGAAKNNEVDPKAAEQKDLKIISGYIKKVTKKKIQKLEPIYTASEHQFLYSPFKKACYGKANLLFVGIGNGGPFGAFSDAEYGEEKPSTVGFIFNIMYSRIIRLQPGQIATPPREGGPSFGVKGGFEITDDKAVSFFDNEQPNFEKVELEKWLAPEPRNAIFGEEHTTLKEYKVYQVEFE